jgi:hypothetical protein
MDADRVSSAVVESATAAQLHGIALSSVENTLFSIRMALNNIRRDAGELGRFHEAFGSARTAELARRLESISLGETLESALHIVEELERETSRFQKRLFL